MTWIADVTERLATASGIDARQLELAPDDAATLLRLASVAAHSSGDRTNAPLLCHVLGRAVALGGSLDELAPVVERAAAATGQQRDV